MSNYLTIIVKEKKFNAVKHWLDANKAADTEMASVRISKDTFIFYVSRGAPEDLCTQWGFIFKGFGINYRDSAVVFGGGGKREFLERGATVGIANGADNPMEGCYYSLEWNETNVLVSNDTFGMCPINYFCEPDMVAISDSIFILTELRKFLNFPCSLHEESAIARAWTNTMAGQMLSEDTLISEIKYVQTASYLKVCINEFFFSATITDGDLTTFRAIRGQSYETTIRTAAQRCASLIQTLSSISANTVRLALSGGMDSRVVLACALASPVSREMALFNCSNKSPAQSKDFNVVKLLSQECGFPLGSRASDIKTQTPTKVTNTLNLWLLGNAGLYDFLVAPGYFSPNSQAFSFGGFGAEIYKGMYGWRSIKNIAGHIRDDDIASAFIAQCSKGLERLGVDVNDKTGSEWHYLAFRNAIHSGRSILTTMVGMRPLMQKELVGLVRSESNPFPTPGIGDKSIMTDLLIAAGPDLAKLPFDDVRKNLAPEYVDKRSRELGGALDCKDLNMYKLYGDFRMIKNCSPILFKNIAKERNSLTLSRDNIISLVQEGFDKISSDKTRRTYKPIFNAGMMRLIEGDDKKPNALRSYPGKLMSFLLLD